MVIFCDPGPASCAPEHGDNEMKSIRFFLSLAVLAFTFNLAVCAQAQTVTYLAVVDGVNGVQPSSAIQATDGNFYATTNWGGAASEGSVIKITPAGELSTLYDFCTRPHCLDGRQPYTPPILGSDGNLYGVTTEGGSTANGGAGWGTVYKLTLDGRLTMLYAFCTGDLPASTATRRLGSFRLPTELCTAPQMEGGSLMAALSSS